MSGLISVLGLVTAVATAITSQLTVINPRIGAWVMLLGTVLSGVGGAVHKRLSLGPATTFLGVIAAVFGILSQATSVLRPSIAQVIAVLGTSATAAGVSLLGWETKPKGGTGGLTMSLGYVPPVEDKSTIRGPKRVKFLGKTIILHILIFSLLFNGCTQKITLDRVGAIVVTAVNAYLLEIRQLHAGGNIDNDKYAALKANGDLAKERAEQFAQELHAFGQITPGNVAQLTQQVASLVGFLRQLLRDAGLDPKSKAIRIVSFAIDTLDAAAIVIASIHPAAIVAANRNTGILRNNPTPSAVTIKIPKPDREVTKALEDADKAGVRFLLPPSTKRPATKRVDPTLMSDFRLQTAP